MSSIPELSYRNVPPPDSASLDRLYVLLREAHAEVELAAHQVQLRRADLEAARKELDKALHMAERTNGKAADIDKAIVDRRRAERGIPLASPPIPVDEETGGPL